MDITGTYSFYLNKINVALNFTKQYKNLHVIYSRQLVIKYITQIKDILEVFKERNDVKMEDVEEVKKILTELHRVEDELYQQEKENLKKVYAREENKNPAVLAPIEIQNDQKNANPLTRTSSPNSSINSIDSYTEDRYNYHPRVSIEKLRDPLVSSYNKKI